MSEQHHVVPVKIYLAIFLSLMALTAITVWVAFHDYGPWNIIVAVSIAIFKATLVVLFFMHVKYSDHVIWVAVSGAFLWLAVLLVLTLSDYYSRGWLITYQ